MFILYKKNGRLTKISDNQNALRANGVVGHFHAPPVVGYNFAIYADSLTDGMDFRRVVTSIIVSVAEENGALVFRTQNSYYLLELFDSQQ